MTAGNKHFISVRAISSAQFGMAFTCGLSTSSILDFRSILFLEAIQGLIYSDSAPEVQRNASKAPAQISVAQHTPMTFPGETPARSFLPVSVTAHLLSLSQQLGQNNHLLSLNGLVFGQIVEL